MKRTSVLLVFGGESSEHDVSVTSARNVHAAINKEKYDVKLGYIDRTGRWWLLAEWSDNPTQQKKTQLVVAPGTGYLLTVPGSDIIAVDVMLPILHGKNGEDGTIQGMAAMMHVPVAGPSLLNAGITMDKDITKLLLNDAGILVVAWELWRTSEPHPKYKEMVRRLGKTLFIKPANAGSSIGVSKARNKEEFEAGLTLAAKHDTSVLIERAIKGIEVQIAVLGNEDPIVTDLCEIESTTDFHDFNDKYSAESSVKFHIPARLGKRQTSRMKETAIKAYKAVHGHGMARIDFFVVDKKTEYVNEINSIPGFTDVSVYPMLWRKSNVNTTELIERLLQLALK